MLFMKPLKVLVTGAAGFVGTNLVSKILESHPQDRVVGLDSLSRDGVRKNLEYLKRKYGKRFEFIQKEIEDFPAEICVAKPDLVYHFAAQVAVTTSVESPVRDFDINGRGTMLVALAAQKVGAPIIYTSTNKVFGDNVNKVPIKEFSSRYEFDGDLAKRGIPEDFPIDAFHHTPYGISKLVGDLWVREVGGIVNRCSCMYGPHQYGIFDQGWVSYIMKKAIRGEKITICGDGKQVRDILHASDVARLLDMEGRTIVNGGQRGEVFNVGGGYDNTISLLELCEELKVKKGDIEFDDWRPADQKVFYCDISKARDVFGWAPEVNVDKGLKGLYQWTKKELSA